MLAKNEGEQTMSYTPEDVDEAGALAELAEQGPALVVRSGGGRAGETFFPTGERTQIGRSPECEVFLDDVTVSRKHAELVRSGDTYTITDLGSLNGTYVNRKRIESAELQDDDEVQVGKYRLTFLRR
jgi:pSer/pThr/pTyr-binding forkhead associated (FHA) protein